MEACWHQPSKLVEKLVEPKQFRKSNKEPITILTDHTVYVDKPIIHEKLTTRTKLIKKLGYGT